MALPQSDGACWTTRGMTSNLGYFVAHDSIIAACGRPKGILEDPAAPRCPVAICLHGITDAVFVEAVKPPRPIRQRLCGPLLPEPPTADAEKEVVAFTEAVAAA